MECGSGTGDVLGEVEDAGEAGKGRGGLAREDAAVVVRLGAGGFYRLPRSTLAAGELRPVLAVEGFGKR